MAGSYTSRRWAVVSYRPSVQGSLRLAQTPPDGTPLPDVRIVAAAPRYFETIGAAPVAGRGFIVSDGAPGERVAIVNQRVASMFFPGREVLGRRIRLPVDGAENAAGWMTIVGVVPNIRQGPGADPTPVVYVPLRQTGPSTVSLLVRGGDRSPPVASLLREQVRALDGDLPLVGLMSMEQALWQAAWVGRMSSGLLRSIAVIGVMLALVGLHAVTTYAVAQRTREFGVRVALGAQRRQLAWLIVRRALLQLGVAAAIGVGCTFAWDRAFSAGSASLAEPFVLACTLLAMAIVGGLAAVVPARRAARLDPLASLRAE
jgi:hypothetical protein